jgi:hypothetical protein
LDEFINWQEFAEVRRRAESHHLSLISVELKAFRHAPVIHGRRISPKPSSHLMDLRWLVLLSALHVVGKQMVTDSVLLENLDVVLSLGNKGSPSTHGTL